MERGTEKVDLYARVTGEIVKAIEAGALTYEMPWHRMASQGSPRNPATGNRYHGVNVVALWSSAHLCGYPLPYWASYAQWRDMGAQVRRGETASLVVFYKPSELREQMGLEADDRKSGMVLRHSSVFNAAQVDGWQGPEPERVDHTTRIEIADAFIDAIGAEILYGGSGASYSPTFDRISMPDRCAFVSTESRSETEGFYSVLFHEHVHWSGSPKRLNRNLAGKFGTDAYAMEELIAELGAAFLCAELGISVEARKDHAAYVNSWLTVLREKQRAIFTASAAAAAACRYLSGVAAEKHAAGVA